MFFFQGIAFIDGILCILWNRDFSVAKEFRLDFDKFGKIYALLFSQKLRYFRTHDTLDFFLICNTTFMKCSAQDSENIKHLK